MSFYAQYPVNGGGGVPVYANFAAFPPGTSVGQLAVAADTGYLYEWDGSMWQLIAGPGSTITVGTLDTGAPSSNGAKIVSNALIMQSASATFPGLVNNTAQTLSGSKTFSSLVNADGGIDRSTSGTLSIGATNSTTINIGNAGATVNIQGTTIYENTPLLQVADPLITVNHGGGAGSGQNSGIEIEEAGSITGYAETSSDRNSWIFKAPNTAGIATVTPGASGITLDQSSHNPVTLGTANGLSLSVQQLSLGLSSTSTTGALSSTDWNTFNNKQAAGNYITALSGDGVATGPGAVAFTLSTVNSNVGSFGTASNSVVFTVNGKGLVTAAANIAIQIAESQVTNLVTDLAGKQPTGNYITALTGDVTATGPGSVAASLVATSNSTLVTLSGLTTATSLASVGTITTGTWSAATIAVNKGGTGQTSYTDGQLLIGNTSGNTLAKSTLTAGSGISITNGNGSITIATSGATVAMAPPTVQKFTTSGASGTYNKNYTFVITSGSATVGATYTNNGVTYTVYATVASATQVVMSGSGAPTATGTLTKASGTGDATITFSQVLAPLYLSVVVAGGGGGGSGSSTNAANNGGTGGTGGTSTFGTSLLSAVGGTGGAGGSQGLGGTGGMATISSPAVGTVIQGGYGGGSMEGQGAANIFFIGGVGGTNPLGGGGSGLVNSVSAGNGGRDNTGAGGGGAGSPSGGISGKGGGAGGYISAIIPSPSATYTYAVGASGTVGATGTGGAAGGLGGSGVVQITEYYQ